MDRDTISEHPLLSAYLHDDIEVSHGADASSPKSHWLRTLYGPGAFIALFCFTMFSILVNILLIWVHFGVSYERTERVPETPISGFMGKSAYTGLSLDTPSTHYHHTDYWGTNQTLADELWESIDTNPMVVALTDDFADTHDLPHSDRFPWDETKGRYFVKVFHQLHCLASIFTQKSCYQALILHRNSSDGHSSTTSEVILHNSTANTYITALTPCDKMSCV